MKKDKAPQKDLGGGKWVMDVQYSRQGIHSNTVAFSDSKSIAKQVESRNIHNQILHLYHSIAGYEQNISVLREKEQQLLNSPNNTAELKAVQEQLNRQKTRIKNRKHQIDILKQKLSLTPTSANTLSKSNHQKSNITTFSSPPPHKTYPSPVISIGDYLYHKTYGNGIVYLKCHDYFKVFFTNKSFHSFSYQDPAFESQTLTQLNHWNALAKGYTTTFSHITNSIFIPSHLQKDYNAFIIGQHHDLLSYISHLFSVSTENSLQYYAQRALNSIYNIQHSEEVFLSLEATEKASVPPPKALPVPNQSTSPNSKSSLHEKVVPPTSPTFPSIQYKPSSDTLYVYSGRIKCIRDNHTMTCVNALIDTASGEVAKLNVNCCLNCNRFYISYDEYERYMAKYKSLLTRIVLVNQNGESTFTNNLSAESILKLCGYSVSQEKGLSQAERQQLLAKIIHADIVSKPDVIQHLNWLIKMNGKKAGNDIAKEKWEDDLFFVRNLDMRSQTNHKISSVSPYSSKKTKKRY